MYKKIDNYGLIGNLHSVALVGLDGSIDWLCLPYIDSPSVFGTLLDDKKGGRFSISPAGDWDSIAAYMPDTNILTTRFRTRNGAMQVTDFMPILYCGECGREEKQQELYRLVEVTHGKVNVEVIFDPRFDYARAKTLLEARGGAVVAKGNGETVRLRSTRKLEVKNGALRLQWRLSKGNSVWFHLAYGREVTAELNPEKAEKALHETREYWETWLKKRETGRTHDLGPYQPMIDRSALVLKLLYYEPTCVIAAAATTSLPEEVGGVRNWDYRFTWVRDTSITLLALFKLGHLSETQGYLKWIERLLAGNGADKIQIMYGLRGEEDLHEEELLHLDGYKGSKPVRIGNGAEKQRQLDIYGEIMLAALRLSDYVGKIDIKMWPFLRGVCDYVVDHWHEKDSGIWEVRGGPYHFVHSKVLCWVALDRGIIIARRYGFPADLEKWEQEKAEIKKEVLEKGWNRKKKAFVQHYDTDVLDSNNLLIPLLGFLPFDDPRVVSTVEATQRELSHDGFLYRYRADDGLEGGEGTFLLCTFWLIRCLVGLKRLEEAENLLKRVEGIANHLGLFAEEYDVNWKEALGNFPQAFTHIGFINSVIALREAKREAAESPELGKETEEKKGTVSGRRLHFLKKIVLNDGAPRKDISEKDISSGLKHSMNILRGAFFDIKHGRIAYERMRKSAAYTEYVEMSNTLKNMDLDELGTREERLAFWINLYNVIVIHAAVELGIKDSIKEVWNFFRRAQYQIGDMFFTPDDIEHGILRENKRPPYSLFRMFGGRDKRNKFVIRPTDPRIHFTLVCASSSCPPIEFYTPENMEKELTVAGEAFLNSGAVKIDRKRGRVSLSRIFKWYDGDFGETTAERLRFIASFLYDDEDRRFLAEHAENLKVDYQDYDWRLNRY